MTMPITPAFQARRIETAAEAACAHAAATGEPVLLVFQKVATTIEPGQNIATSLQAHDIAVAGIVERETEHPVLSHVPPMKGDLVETMVDDHYTRIRSGTAGVVCTTTDDEKGVATHITVRFAARSVDFEASDYPMLRHVRTPRR